MTGNSHLLWTYKWVKVGTVTVKWAAAVSRGIPRIFRGEPRNLANGAAEFGKIFRGKLWSLVITSTVAATSNLPTWKHSSSFPLKWSTLDDCAFTISQLQGHTENFWLEGPTRRPVRGDRFETPNPLPTPWLFWILVSIQHCVKTVGIDYYLQLLLAINCYGSSIPQHR